MIYDPNPTTHKRSRKALYIILGILALPFVLILLVTLAISTPFVAAKLGTIFTHSSGRNVSLKGNIEAHLWSLEPRIVLNDVEVGNAEWSKTPDMFQAEQVDVSIKLMPLLRGRVVLPELLIEKPVLTLEKNAKGDANWEFTENAQAAPLKDAAPKKRSEIPVIHHLVIHDGKLAYNDPGKNINTTLAISTVKGEGDNENLSLKGSGSYDKSKFELDVTGASVLQLRESDEPFPFKLKTVVGETSATVEGTVKDPVKMEAVDVTLDLKGANMADLFPLTGIALPPSPAYEVRGHLTTEDQIWHFNKFKGTLGNSDISGDVEWRPINKPPYFNAQLVSNNLDMKDLSGLLGAHKKPADEARVIPDTPLDISRLKAMDADASFHGQHIKAPDVLSDFYMKLSLNKGTLTVEPLTFGFAKGQIAASLRVEGKQQPPQVTLNVWFTRLALSSMFDSLAARFGKENVAAGLIGGMGHFKGTGKSLRDIMADSNGDMGIGMEGGQLSELLLQLVGLDLFRAAGLFITDNDKPVNINCVVADFAVKDGMMTAQEFVVDTDVSNIKGEGTINLKDEKMDLRLVPHAKKPSLISARSPIVVDGTLKHPNPGVDVAALAARGGAAAGLAVILTPIGSLLAFIEPGLGKDSNCASYLNKLKQDTGAKILPTANPAPAQK